MQSPLDVMTLSQNLAGASCQREENSTSYIRFQILAGKAPAYFQNYFNQRRSDIHSYSTRSCDNLNVEKTNLEIVFLREQLSMTQIIRSSCRRF